MGFVRDAHGGVARVEFSELRGDLARRQAPAQQGGNRLEQSVADDQLGRRTGLAAAAVAALLGMVAAVVGAGLVAVQLAADGRGCPIEHAGDRPHAQSLLAANGDGLAILVDELCVVRFFIHATPYWF